MDSVPVVQKGVASAGEAAASGAALAEIRALADQGRLEEAERQCRALLARGRPCARSCSLMGLIRLAHDDVAQAREFFQKALYLDPHEEEALAHLVQIFERLQDDRNAEVYRARLARAGREQRRE